MRAREGGDADSRVGCFSGEPLGEDEYGKGRRGDSYKKYANNRETFQISMGDAPLKHCGWCCIGGLPCTFLCATHHMRYKVLNHVSPGSGWDNYVCCQGYVPACCCFSPGSCCESDLPRTCMCVEAFCCAGLAISSTRFVMMDQYHLAADECDNRLIRFNNCIQILSCVCHVAAIFNNNLRSLAQIIDLIADIVFFSTAGCMTAQVDYELKYRESLGGGPAPRPLPGGPGIQGGAVTSPVYASGGAMPTATVVGVAQPAGAPPPYAGAPPAAEDAMAR